MVSGMHSETRRLCPNKGFPAVQGFTLKESGGELHPGGACPGGVCQGGVCLEARCLPGGLPRRGERISQHALRQVYKHNLCREVIKGVRIP